MDTIDGGRRAPSSVDGEVVWFWPPDAGVKSADDHPPVNGDYQARHTGKITK
jgi:hypothetical protein